VGLEPTLAGFELSKTVYPLDYETVFSINLFMLFQGRDESHMKCRQNTALVLNIPEIAVPNFVFETDSPV
jgi:hypothetical protein